MRDGRRLRGSAKERREERGRIWERGGRPPNDFYCLSFVISLVFYIFPGKAWAEGKGELATCRHCPDSGREPARRHSLYRLNASMIKQKKKWIIDSSASHHMYNGPKSAYRTYRSLIKR